MRRSKRLELPIGLVNAVPVAPCLVVLSEGAWLGLELHLDVVHC